MAKYQVLKRVPWEMKNENNVMVSGEMVEFVQITKEGPSQVQVYFVPEGKTDMEILGVSAKNHEDELKSRGGYIGLQSPLSDANIEPESIVDVVL